MSGKVNRNDYRNSTSISSHSSNNQNNNYNRNGLYHICDALEKRAKENECSIRNDQAIIYSNNHVAKDDNVHYTETNNTFIYPQNSEYIDDRKSRSLPHSQKDSENSDFSLTGISQDYGQIPTPVLSQDLSSNIQSQQLTLESFQPDINNSCLGTNSIIDAFTKKEFVKKMKKFNESDFSTHLFLKPSQGSLCDWEHAPRRFFYLQIIKPILSECFARNIKLSTHINHYEIIVSKYKFVTGSNEVPIFYEYNKSKTLYTKMRHTDIIAYFSTIFQKMHQTKRTINQYEISPIERIQKIIFF